PGQGSQMVGMGVALAEESLSAKRVFEQVNDAIGEDLFAIMKDGPSEVLQLTRNAQPAIFASSLAVVKAIEERFGSIENHTSFVAGHSLGEYSALAAANSLDISAAAMLLRIRGDAMQSATPIGTGAMAAILGADINQIDRLIENFYAENNENLEQIVQIANDNAPGQIVVSGHKQAVEKLCDMAKQAGIKRSLMLPVSAPFHCDLMAPACDVMSEHLANSEFRQPEITLMCNVTAAAEADIYQLRVNLVNQVTAKVRWRETLLNLSSQGVTQFVEIGTGKILSGLVKRTVSDAEIISLQSFQDITDYFS
ncbi:MAG: ACP S-malonyltransferase, partial [Alphaproteobacteria bacterium]|nr:ACP S-malonyltransferase [Alphaproteobacteria bacterium]